MLKQKNETYAQLNKSGKRARTHFPERCLQLHTNDDLAADDGVPFESRMKAGNVATAAEAMAQHQ